MRCMDSDYYVRYLTGGHTRAGLAWIVSVSCPLIRRYETHLNVGDRK